jgi:hypothetical protein
VRFGPATKNNDGKLDLAEFQSSVGTTAKLALDASDANDNGSLTEEEAAVALGDVVRRLGIPMPSGQSAAK